MIVLLYGLSVARVVPFRITMHMHTDPDGFDSFVLCWGQVSTVQPGCISNK